MASFEKTLLENESEEKPDQDMDLEELKAQKTAEWEAELKRTEEDISSLREVLASKMQKSQELKRNLGITKMKEIQGDMSRSLTTLQESQVMQKTNKALKTAGERTSAAFANVGRKLGDIRNSQAIKSFEEKAASVYDNVKTKVLKNKEDTTPISPGGSVSPTAPPPQFESDSNKSPNEGGGDMETVPTL